MPKYYDGDNLILRDTFTKQIILAKLDQPEFNLGTGLAAFQVRGVIGMNVSSAVLNANFWDFIQEKDYPEVIKELVMELRSYR